MGHVLGLSELFPRQLRSEQCGRAPKIAALRHDIAQAPDAIDLDRVAQILAEHAPPPRRFRWHTGPEKTMSQDAFAFFAQDRGRGAPVTLLWRLWRVGCMDALLNLHRRRATGTGRQTDGVGGLLRR